MQDVADDRDVQPLEAAELLLDRVEVEQRLRRVLVLAVARVHHVRLGHGSATSWGAPICGWRITITSGSYAESVSAVSFSDSPFSTDEPVDLTESVSAESRFAASSNDDDVRVEDS